MGDHLGYVGRVITLATSNGKCELEYLTEFPFIWLSSLNC